MKMEEKKTHEHNENCQNQHTISWFEIPATNIERAAKFYSAILGVKIDIMKWEGYQMGMFPGGKGIIHGALVQGEHYVPSDKGTVVYLNGGNDLNNALKKVEPAGGKVCRPKFSIGEHGYIAFFTDTEGNRVALHSMN